MEKIYPIPRDLTATAWIDSESYAAMYKQSVDENEHVERKIESLLHRSRE